MKDYTQKLYELWNKANEKYQSGNLNPSNYFDEQEVEFLHTIGMSAQEMFDFAEDYSQSHEPPFSTVALIQDIRRTYFLQEQKGKHSSNALDPETLPPKNESINGITWLPRIIPKALAKLRGELSEDIMFCCGGDRNFFKQNHIHPAEFLRVVSIYENDPEAVINWVIAHRERHASTLEKIRHIFD